MKKRSVLLIIFLIFSAYLFSESMYYYGNGFSSAEYKGTTSTVRAYNLWQYQKQRAHARLYKVEKLTEEERTFLWGALKKYDYRYGEVYFILISPSAFQQLFIYAEIQKDKSLSWYGWRN